MQDTLHERKKYEGLVGGPLLVGGLVPGSPPPLKSGPGSMARYVTIFVAFLNSANNFLHKNKQEA